MKYSIEEIEEDIKCIEIKFQTKLYSYKTLEEFLLQEFIIDKHKLSLDVRNISREHFKFDKKCPYKTYLKLVGKYYKYSFILNYRAYIIFKNNKDVLTSKSSKRAFKELIEYKLQKLNRVQLLNKLLDV